MSTTPITNSNSHPARDSSFKANSGEDTLTFRLTLDKNNKPIKIGDGTYGSVFKAYRSSMNYAVKIFYRSNSQKEAFEKELNAAELIRGKLLQNNLSNLAERLVLPEARTESFDTTPAASVIQEHYTDLALSEYALVMPLYECSLKEWLEQGRPNVDENQASGYTRILALQRDLREYFAVWIARRVAEGVLALHAAGFHHHDIKPANILLKTSGARGLDVALADLGFLHTTEASVGTISASLHGAPSGGTRHYRSPEQRDFFDVCDVEVRPLLAGQCELLIRDPKFDDSLTETGDFAVFSKHAAYQRHPIISVQRLKRSTNQPAEKSARVEKWSAAQIATNASNQSGEKPAVLMDGARTVHTVIKLMGSPHSHFVDDARTQIVIQKRHTVRTDLFGLGALIYDLITCGRSPERFYDRIRRMDSQGSRQVDALVRSYNQRQGAYNSISPEHNYIFELLKADHSYPSGSVLEILLKLMLSQGEDSYYAQGPDNAQVPFSAKDSVGILKQVARDLESALDQKVQLGAKAHQIQDYLWNNDIPDQPSVQIETPEDLIDIIRTIQACADARTRLVSGGFYQFYHLFEFISKYASGERGYYTVLSPIMNLSYKDNKDRTDFFVHRDEYQSKEQFLRALAEETPILPRSNDLFLPIYVNELTRRATIRFLPGPQFPATDTVPTRRVGRATLEFTSHHPLWTGTAEGDLIVSRFDDVPPRLVLEIKKLDPKSGTLDFEQWLPSNRRQTSDQMAQPLESLEDALIIKPIEPQEYYLAVAAMLLHQIFFVDNKNDLGFAPPTYHFVEQSIAADYFDKKSAEAWFSRIEQPLKRMPGRLEQLLKGSLDKNSALVFLIYECLADLYLLLATRFMHGMVAQKRNRVALVKQYLSDLAALIVQVEPSFQNPEDLKARTPNWEGLKGSKVVRPVQPLETVLRQKSLLNVSISLRS